MTTSLGTSVADGASPLSSLSALVHYAQVGFHCIEADISADPHQVLRATLAQSAEKAPDLALVTSLIRQVTGQYYQLIDARLLDRVMGLFANDATYCRAGLTLTGRDEISTFYTRDRQLKGRHVITGLWPTGLGATVCGEFQHDDSKRTPIHFMDHWIFNQDGYVSRRETYLLTGSEITLK